MEIDDDFGLFFVPDEGAGILYLLVRHLNTTAREMTED